MNILKYILFSTFSFLALFAFSKQEKVIQIFQNGEVIQEFVASEIDYIEVNDLIEIPQEVNATLSNKQITIRWKAVEGATYNVYRSGNNVDFSLLASDLKETEYTDVNPLPDYNYYRVSAVINGQESKKSETVTTNIPKENLPSGIYLGINGFSRGFQIQPIQLLTDENQANYHDFISGLTATQSFTWLYYAVDKSIDNLQLCQFPEDLSDVSIVTFTDGLDIGSLDEKDKEAPDTYFSNAQYREALHNRLISEKVSNVDISAYTIGVLEGKGSSLTTFKSNMQSLATSTSNVYEVEKIESLNQVFEQIANSLSETKYVQKFVLSISGHGEGELCRFTFDNVSSYQSSKLYIEGTYRRKDKALINIKYMGLTSTSGSEVQGSYNEETGKYDYVFDGLKANDGTLIPTTKVQHWFTDEGIWQDVDDEFFFDPEDASLEKIKRSAAIVLNLDCSKSMDGQKLMSLKVAANKFIQILCDNSVDPSEVSAVELNQSNVSLQIGETVTLKANVIPSTAKLKTVTWSSSNPAIATVDGNGKVTAISLGEADITVTTKDGGFTATCKITVIPTPEPANQTCLRIKEGFKLTWDKAPNTTYRIYRSADGKSFVKLATDISDNFYIDNQPLIGQNFYKISAISNDIESETTGYFSVMFTPSTEFTKMERVGKEIHLAWSEVTGAKYDVYRLGNTNSTATKIAAGLDVCTYTDNSPLSKQNYYYVIAVMNGQDSWPSDVFGLEYPFINGYEYVDLGLPSGIKWATCNVGASTPAGAGAYYAWGEVVPKVSYDQNNSKMTGNTKWYNISGDPTVDAATSNWGGSWRIPTTTEFNELIQNCKWTWTTFNGTNGYSIKGPNNNTIFLPVTGLILETNKQSTDMGFYWSANYYNNILAWRLNFTNSVFQVADNYKLVGLPIRAVTD